jgi:hypothetical protein
VAAHTIISAFMEVMSRSTRTVVKPYGITVRKAVEKDVETDFSL